MLCIFCKLQLAHGEWRDQEVEEKSCSTVSQAKTLRKFGVKMATNFSVVDTIISATKTPGQLQSLVFVMYKQVIKNMKILL